MGSLAKNNIKKEKTILNNGIEIPPIILGTAHPLHDKKLAQGKGKICNCLIRIFYNKIYSKFLVLKQVVAIAGAIKMGYRAIDTSAAYGNEKFIKWGIKLSGIKRRELFITTRVSNQQQWKGHIKKSLLESMRALGVDYVDLYMFHWPVTDVFIATWRQMESVYEEGLVKYIGVANCHQHHLEKLLAGALVVPAINQFEIHPLMTQKPLIAYCMSKGIAVEAYTPIGRNHEKLMRNDILKKLSKKYNKTIPQIILRWHYQNRIISVPRSTSFKHLKENLCIFNFELTPEEMKKIDSINTDLRLRYNPDDCDFNKL
ncbi:MAG: aldo/keto reductase [Candidatus Omnitrophica bacterium]|nr:aldo/keto reductase [Candidatus Omnitrophota bacterium]MDD5429619.1 aldo/keto reductase [Candidatus Omnitrophota bacterium]